RPYTTLFRSHRDGMAERRAEGATGDLTEHGAVVIHHGISRTAGPATLGSETDQRAGSVGRRDRVLADEALLVGDDHAAEAGLRGLGVSGEFVAVERHARLQAQGVAGSETSGHETVRLAGGEHGIPQRLGVR